MPKHGRKYREASALVEAERRYPLDEAAELLPKLSISRFDGTVEAHLRLGVDPRHADQLVRGTVVLPHGTATVTDACGTNSTPSSTLPWIVRRTSRQYRNVPTNVPSTA